MSAAETLTRIVGITAELTLRSKSETPTLTIEKLAQAHGVTPKQIERDIQTLTLLGDSADSDWLLSLRIVQEGNRVSIASSGPFQRPIRFTPEEMLAVQMALVADGYAELAAELGPDQPRPFPRVPDRPRPSPTLPDLVSAAITGQRRVRIRYAGDRRDAPSERTIQPHQAVEYRNRVYIVAWCEKSKDWRRFRLDRILEATHDGTFEPRSDFTPLRATAEVFQAGQIEEVTVRYRDGAARWARERYPDSEQAADGSVLVRFKVANPEWLVRLVLEIGSDAEVIEPKDYRRAMRLAVA